ncbi:MAG: hypothetical protein FOGNACKC_04950 [Anaerolineae bacterium]|nr:hypothetical protein [Anaerolineae bacterium]
MTHHVAHGVVADKESKPAPEFEPLLPIEKKLVAWSLILGVVLLGVLVVVSYTLFPGSF